jgi:DNA-binding MarR family transcriptional regulator
MIDQLEAMGFVTRSADTEDRRAKLVKFTPSGLRLLETIRKAVAAGERELAARIGDTAVADLRAALLVYCRTEDAAEDAPPVRAGARSRR